MMPADLLEDKILNSLRKTLKNPEVLRSGNIYLEFRFPVSERWGVSRD
jgi:hypothetical protein